MTLLSASEVLDLSDRWSRRSLPDRAIAILRTVQPNIAVEELDLLERDVRLLDLRRSLFGSVMELVLACEQCEIELSFSIDVGEIIDSLASPQAHQPLATLVDDVRVRFRLPTAGDLCAAAQRGSHDDAMEVLIARIVIDASRDGQLINPSSVAGLEAALSATIASLEPNPEVRFHFECVECGHESNVDLDIVSYFWSELARAGERLVRDVHALAEAYGWNESDILAMTETRRAAYLALVA